MAVAHTAASRSGACMGSRSGGCFNRAAEQQLRAFCTDRKLTAASTQGTTRCSTQASQTRLTWFLRVGKPRQPAVEAVKEFIGLFLHLSGIEPAGFVDSFELRTEVLPQGHVRVVDAGDVAILHGEEDLTEKHQALVLGAHLLLKPQQRLRDMSDRGVNGGLHAALGNKLLVFGDGRRELKVDATSDTVEGNVFNDSVKGSAVAKSRMSGNCRPAPKGTRHEPRARVSDGES